MKPCDLRPAFRFEERRVLLQDGILHLPRHYDDHEKIELMPQPLYVEFCSGNGHWVIEQARARPDCNWIAVEMRFARVAKVWAKRKNEQLDNLLIVCGEAQTFARHYLSDNSVREVYINFPDPWPKARHAKHRLVQKPFLDDLIRVMEPESLFTFVTDDAPYAEQLEELMELPLEHRCNDLSDYGDSTFAKLWRRRGRSFHSLRYRKQALQPLCHRREDLAL